MWRRGKLNQAYEAERVPSIPSSYLRGRGASRGGEVANSVIPISPDFFPFRVGNYYFGLSSPADVVCWSEGLHLTKTNNIFDIYRIFPQFSFQLFFIVIILQKRVKLRRPPEKSPFLSSSQGI